MTEKEFNLLDEPWIMAADKNGATVALSLIGIFKQAHEIIALSGELPAQDSAVLRLLLAILYAAFPYTNEDGAPVVDDLLRDDPDPQKKIPEEIWLRFWQRGSFSMNVIENYLQKYHDRFWLFHPTRPFWQIAALIGGTQYGAAKLNGEISESSNKIRLFQSRTGESKKALTYAEAARWLIYLNAYDDTSAKPSRVRGKKFPSPGAGWIGKLGFINAVGANLFETLMLNFTMKNDNDELWDVGGAVWELDKPVGDERVEIEEPTSPAELLTLQSRRVLLERSAGYVTGYRLLGGDFFQKENAFNEQMTIWRQDSKNKEVYTPKRHDPSRQLWRGLSSILAKSDDVRVPGVVNWLFKLENAGYISTQQIQLTATSVKYGDKDFFAVDAWSDAITINAGLLSTLGRSWINKISEELIITDKIVGCLTYLAADIAEAAGEAPGNTPGVAGKKNAAREEAYYRLDEPFRDWLARINPQEGNMDDKIVGWRKTAGGIILQIGAELVANAGDNAFVGRYVKSQQRLELKATPRVYAKFKGLVNILVKGERRE